MFSSKIKLSLFLCLSMCLGIGILRFSYTALLPSTREAFGWSPSFASLLGSANLLGYLIGAFWAMKLPQNKSMATYIQIAAIAGTLSLASCAWGGLPEFWYVIWRIISGISGGLLMILSPSVVAQCCQLQDRFKINFVGFSGIGLGVLMATLFLPYIKQISTQYAWLILFSFATVICIILSLLLKEFKQHLTAQTPVASNEQKLGGIFYCLLAVYSASAFAYVPHSLFWIDYLSHTLQLSPFGINSNWILYGVGSALGAFSAYTLAQKFGNITTLKILYSIYVMAIFIAIFNFSPLFTFISSFLTGLLNPAVVFLTSYSILQIYGSAYKKLWSIATLCFATVQLVGGLSFSFLQSMGANYSQQFILAATVLLIGTMQLFWFTRQEQAIPSSQAQ